VSTALLDWDLLSSSDASAAAAACRAASVQVGAPGQRELEPQRSRDGLRDDARPSPGPSGVRSLESVITGAWRSLERGETAPCPVCAGVLEPCDFGGAETLEGACMSCGSELR
jgi:hypothetical protein